jgi:lipoate-protein ligase A
MPPPPPRPALNLLRLHGFPIVRQLVLEEALFRASAANWFVMNDGAAAPAVVLGISGRPAELVHGAAAAAAAVPLVRRFTGGGTVVVDGDTLLTSLIVSGDAAAPHVPPHPRPVMEWAAAAFGAATRGLLADAAGAPLELTLRENDFVLGASGVGVKCGGNAQAISRGRWLHHTSFLWDYCPARMALLRAPARQPAYRAGREHGAFVARLCDAAPSRAALVAALAGAAEAAGFAVREASLGEAEAALALNKLCGTRVLDLAEYLDLAETPAPAAAAGR